MSLVEIAKRKRLELEQKMSALEIEFKYWFDNSADANGRFAKHHTQIRAIKAMLQPRHQEIRDDLDAYAPDASTNDFLASCANNEKLILSEHRIWNYFRNKFIQRNEDTFDTYLKAADEFAWECYRPIQETVYPDPATAKRKEPPLVFFNGGASPFSVSRDRSFEPEAVVGGGITLDPETVGKLPIPVIGIPWHQINHLPEILVIGHEVGHIVQNDFNLTPELEKHLVDAMTGRSEFRLGAWNSWLGEVFADLYGCLSTGPAFAGTLIDFVVNDPKAIYREVRQAPNWGKYPTVYLRVELVLFALEYLEAGARIDKYREIWKTYQSQMDSGFLEDIKILVPCLLDAKFQELKGKSVREIIKFDAETPTVLDNTVAVFNYIVNKDSEVPIPTHDLRIIFPALRIAFEQQPDVYIKNGYSEAVLSFIEKNVLKPALRSGEKTLSNDAVNSKIQAYDQAGADLLKFNQDN